ncbi:MAG TPA: glycosyltransferase family 2 protein [Reyranella sp.]|nr:glycosyltransferase family 2 protein [Reyranella sp.]
MTGRLQILVPIASESAFFDPAEYFFPKPLIEVAGRPMIERTIAPLREAFPDARFLFVVRRENVVRFSLDSVLRLTAGEDCSVVVLSAPTRGALCSCLMAVDALDLAAPLLISNGDQLVQADLGALLGQLQSAGADAGVVTFKSVHPRWSYVKLDDDGNVTEAAEKNVISTHAIAGLYWFRTAQQFVDAATATILVDDHLEGVFFIAPSLNQVLLQGGKVVRAEIPADAYFSFYSPQRIQDYAVWSRTAPALRSASQKSGRTVVVIPAAGEGSRFHQAGWRRPKPFIDVAGRSMIERVVENVAPPGARTVALIRKEQLQGQHAIVSRLAQAGVGIVPVERATEGTICTVMLARREFADDDAILVANSDQLVDFSVADFIEDCFHRDLDGSILVFRDAQRDPKWSFAKTNGHGLVTEVAEKKPISDLATVGVYLFRRARQMIDATVDMIAHNDRVNGEFYTCPVYNYMIAAGARIGVYEVQPAAMHGLGIPADLERYLAGVGAPHSEDAP